MTVIVTNAVSEIGRLHASVSQFCRENGLSADIEGDLSLALEEILMNVIRYGHPEGGRHEILINLSLENECVTVEVEDDGTPFNPLDAPEPDIEAPIEKRPIGGLGIHLVRILMDGLEYRRTNGRNLLSMRKRLTDK